jgi:hypothetical protein
MATFKDIALVVAHWNQGSFVLKAAAAAIFKGRRTGFFGGHDQVVVPGAFLA